MPIVVNDKGILIFDNDKQPLKVLILISVIFDGCSNLISLNFLQSKKVPLPIDVTENGIFIFVKDKHPLKE